MGNIAAGDLDRRIDIEIATKTRDAAHDVISTWGAFARRSARVRDARGREFFGAQQMVHEADRMFTVRSDAQTRLIAPESHRIVFDNRVHEIVAVAQSRERDDTIDILCTTRPDQQGERGPVVV